jgi:hypothetical protein
MRSNKNLAKFALLSILIFTLATGFSYAQRITGNIRGVVTDDEGVPFPGVTVDLSSPVLMGGVHSEITGTKGGYRFSNLPPGVYKIVFSLEGFQTIEKLQIKVSVKGTVTENTIMKQTTIKETVTVIGEAPVIDLTSSEESKVYDRDLLEKIPSGRFSFMDVVKQAPGIITPAWETYGTLPMIAFGSNAESNSFQLDGLDITSPRLGTAIVRPNQDIFSEVEVAGIGAPAEYGNYTGAIVNVVTKSGGNKFSGSLSYYGQFKGLTGDNNPDPENTFSYARHKFLDAAFTLGGPIVKDKLWFFSSVNLTSDDRTDWRSDPQYHSPASDDNYFFKLSAQITSAHKLAGVFAYRNSGSKDVVTELFMAEALKEYKGSVPYWNIIYNWIMSPNAYLELKTSGFRESSSSFPREGLGADLNTPQHYDMATGLWSEGVWWPSERDYRRFQATGALSYFAEDFLGGDHDFKIGIQYNRSYAGTLAGYAGGREYWDWYGDLWYMYEQDPSYYGGLVNNIGVFIDDAWSIGSRLTVNLGFRYDHSNAGIPAYVEMDAWTKTQTPTPAIKDMVVWNIFSPRIGMVYQLTPDGKTIIKGSYRRIQDPYHTGHNDWPGPNSSDYYGYYWDGAGWVRFWGAAAEDAWTQTPSDLKFPYADMFSIGFQREVFTGFSMGIFGVYKNQKDGVSYYNSRGIYELVPLVSPDNGQTYQVYNQLNPGENKFELTNPEGFGQKYKGVTLQLDKRYSNNWLLSSSLTLSKSEGLTAVSRYNYNDQMTLTSWTYNEGKDPNDWTNGQGLMPMDRKWVFKLQLAYNFPWDILASVNYLYMSGRPIGALVRVFPDQGQRTFLAEPRIDANRTDPYGLLDIRLSKTFNLHESFRFSVMVDVFNVFNNDTAIDFYTYDLWNSYYLEPWYLPAPVRAQIGLKLEF